MKIKAVVIAIAFGLCSPVFAANEYTAPDINNQACIDGEKICLGDDIMKEVIKESMQMAGKYILEKYLKKENQPQSTTTSTTSSTSNSTSTPSTDTSTTTTTSSDSTSYTTRTDSSSDSATATTSSSTTNSGSDDLIIID